MFLFRKKDKAAAGKPPLAPKSTSGQPKVKTAEEAKREALQNEKLEKEKEKKVEKPKEEKLQETVERLKDEDSKDDDDESKRKRASRRISQTQIGKPLSYNQYITQNKLSSNKPQ